MASRLRLLRNNRSVSPRPCGWILRAYRPAIACPIAIDHCARSSRRPAYALPGMGRAIWLARPMAGRSAVRVLPMPGDTGLQGDGMVAPSGRRGRLPLLWGWASGWRGRTLIAGRGATWWRWARIVERRASRHRRGGRAAAGRHSIRGDRRGVGLPLSRNRLSSLFSDIPLAMLVSPCQMSVMPITAPMRKPDAHRH